MVVHVRRLDVTPSSNKPAGLVVHPTVPANPNGHAGPTGPPSPPANPELRPRCPRPDAATGDRPPPSTPPVSFLALLVVAKKKKAAPRTDKIKPRETALIGRFAGPQRRTALRTPVCGGQPEGPPTGFVERPPNPGGDPGRPALKMAVAVVDGQGGAAPSNLAPSNRSRRGPPPAGGWARGVVACADRRTPPGNSRRPRPPSATLARRRSDLTSDHPRHTTPSG